MDGPKAPTDELPFRVSIRDKVVVVDRFSPHLDRYYTGLERELPVVRDAVVRLAAEGHTRFVFDLRTAGRLSAYPVAKWGAVYGALSDLRRQCPEAPATALARWIKLVGDGESLREIRIYRLDRLFDCFSTLAAAIESVQKGEPGAEPGAAPDTGRM